MENSINVSVIVAVYNADKYLNEFMDSLIMQTLEEIQIICIDDCSSDNSYEILLNYKNSANILVLKNECNIGAANTRNRGLELAKGEYIICVDCDDVLHKDYLINLYSACKENDADIGVGYVENFRGNILNRQKLGRRFLNRNKIKSYPIFNNPRESKYLFQIITHCAYDKMIRRNIICENDICFQNLPCTNDLSFSYTSFLCANKAIFVDNAKYFYRCGNPESISGKQKGKFGFLFEAMDKVYQYMDMKGINENLLHSFNLKILKDSYSYYYEQSELIRQDYIRKLENYYKKWNIDNYYTTHIISEIETKILFNILENNFEQNYMDIIFDISGVNVIEQIKQYQEKNQKVAFWGVNKNGLRFIENLRNQQYSISYIIDNDIQKQGKEIENIEICSYEQVKHKISLVLVTSYAVYEGIEEQIESKIPIINVIELMEEKALKIY